MQKVERDAQTQCSTASPLRTGSACLQYNLLIVH